MGVDGPASAGLDCDVDGVSVGLTLTRVGAACVASTCFLFATLSSSATPTADRFTALFCFGFGPIDLNGRVWISAKSSSP